MKLSRTGFAVVYQWRVRAGMESQFRSAWEDLTAFLREHRGALGSRLHRTDNGTVVAYAQWPDQATWERSCAQHEEDAVLSQRLLNAVDETWSPMFLTTVADRLVAEQTPLDRPLDPHH